MAHPKLFTLIDAIDLKQINALRRYTLSKVSEQSEAYLIMEMIIKTKDKREKYGDADTLQKAYFPTIKTKNFVNYLSLLYGYAEEWIALTQMEEDEYTKDLLVQRWLNNHGLYSLSDQVVKKALKKIEETKQLDHNLKFFTSEFFFQHFFSNHPIDTLIEVENFIKMIKSFEEYYFSRLFFMLSEIKRWNLSSNYDLEYLYSYHEEIFKKHNKTELTKTTMLFYNLIKGHDFYSFLTLKSYVLENKLVPLSKYHQTITFMVIKSSVTLRSLGYDVSERTVFELTKYGIENGVFLDEGKFTPIVFHNLIVRQALFLSFDELTNFVNKYIIKVNSNNLEATKSLCLAQICFYKKNFELIHQYAWRGDFELFSQKVIAQGLLLIGAYMKKENDFAGYKKTLSTSVNFFERNKNKMSHQVYMSYLNLIEFMKKLEKEDKDKISLNDYKPLIYLSWCKDMLGLQDE